MNVRTMQAALIVASLVLAPRTWAFDDVLDPRINTFVLVIRPDPTPRTGHPTIQPAECWDRYRVRDVDGEWLDLEGFRARVWVRADQTVPTEEAPDFFKRKLELSPDDPDLLVRLGSAIDSVRPARPDEARARFDRAIELDPNRAILYQARALHWFGFPRDFARAIDDINQAIALEPTNSIFLEERAKIEERQKKYDETIADLTEAIRIDPKRGSPYGIRAAVYRSEGKVDLALADCAEEIRLSGEIGLIHRGIFYGMMGRLDEAIADYDAIIRLDPNHAAVYLWRGGMRRRVEKYELAVEDYTQFLRLISMTDASGERKKEQDRSKADCLSQRADTFSDMGANDQALADHTEAIRLVPDDARYRLNRGDFHLRLAKYDAALNDFEQALQINPKHKRSLEQKSWVLATHPVDARRNGKEALRLANMAKDLGREKAPENLATRAAAHAEVGDFEEAVRCQEMAIKALPDGDDRVEAYQSWLDLYRKKQPLRQPSDAPKLVG